jgi:hypothetical protein
MINLLAKKSDKGDLSINLARHHLAKHEWGLARIAIENGIAKGGLKEPDQAARLLVDIHHMMGTSPATPPLVPST